MRDDITLPEKLNEILATKADRAIQAAQITEAIRNAGPRPFSQTGLANETTPNAAFPLRKAAPRGSSLDNVFVKTHYRWVGLYDVDLTRGLVSNIAWSGPAAPAYPSFPITKGLTSRAIAQKQTVNVGDVASDPNYLTALDTTRSEIILPILDKTSTVIGTLDVESEKANAFDPATQKLLEECARLLTAFWISA